MAWTWFSFGLFPLAALLKLKTDVGICAVNSLEVLPACLPDPNLKLPEWTECEISGYGKDSECKQSSSPIHGCSLSLTRVASRGQAKFLWLNIWLTETFSCTVSAVYSQRIKRGYVRLWPEERCVPSVLSGRMVTSNMLCAGDSRNLDDACKVRTSLLKALHQNNIEMSHPKQKRNIRTGQFTLYPDLKGQFTPKWEKHVGL